MRRETFRTKLNAFLLLFAAEIGNPPIVALEGLDSFEVKFTSISALEVREHLTPAQNLTQNLLVSEYKLRLSRESMTVSRGSA